MMDFLSIIEQIENLFQNILEISEEQLLLIRKSDADDDISEQLSAMLKKRQEIMDRIDLLGEDLREKEPSANNVADQQDGKKNQPYFEKKEEIINIIRAIENNDEKSQDFLQKIIEGTRNKMNKARTSKKAYDAYMPQEPYSDAWFFDKKK